MILHIRHNRQFFVSVQSLQELRDLISNYIPGRPLIIGNYAIFNKPMKFMLLKFLEENPEVDVFTSEDIDDPILLSRFVKVEKEHLQYTQTHDPEGYKKSNHDFMSIDSQLQSLSPADKLLVKGATNQQLDLLLSL